MAANAPAVQAAIFDLDGTLVDTNDTHVEAWLAAFRDFGYHVPRSRILPEIGKGGDKLVPSILGEDSDEQDGEALRNAHGRHFMVGPRPPSVWPRIDWISDIPVSASPLPDKTEAPELLGTVGGFIYSYLATASTTGTSVQ